MRARPEELLERMRRRRADMEADEAAMASAALPTGRSKKKRAGPTSVLQAASQLAETGQYKPRTRETQQAHEQLLSLAQGQLGSVPREVLASAADEVLAALKDESVTDHERKKNIEELLGSLSDRKFHDLVEIGKRITDYHDVGGGDEAAIDENIPVMFDGDDEQNNENLFVADGEEDESGDGEEAGVGAVLHGGEGAGIQRDGDAKPGEEVIPAAQIDAYWLQRQVSRFQADPNRARDLAEQLLAILQNDDATACENALVELLEYEHFDFVRLLMHNRSLIVWTTLYRRAKDDAERKAIEDRLLQLDLGDVLDQISGKAAKKGGAASGVKDENGAGDEGGVKPMDVDEDQQQQQAGGDVVPAHWRIARKVLDLEALVFDEGGRFMSNKKVVLPPGTQRIPHKGYEEVQVPAPARPPESEMPKLVPVTELPPWAQEVFRPKGKGISHFNSMQSAVFQKAFFSADNLLIAAPTGSGKTNAAMLCVLHEIGLNRRQDGTIDRDMFKIVYIAPMKSLVQEMVLNFGNRLAPLGIQVRELSGDQNLTKQQISETQIIVTTPEKWDVVTRHGNCMDEVRLIIIDEIHLLHDERGPVLEAVIARTNRYIEESQQMVRLVGLSATLPNYEDVAMLLRVDDSGIFHFGGAHRPVPLELTFLGVDSKKAVQRFRVMNEICYEQVLLRAGKSQTIIFVHSRKDTAKTAKFIRDMALAQDKLNLFLADYGASREILTQEAATVKNTDLKDLMPFGFGIHHAGMSREDRTLVEALFDAGHLQVLVSTATLAWGVNLPARTTIIKGTQVYSPEKGRWTELSGLDVMQMLGRAGRPQYDTKGEGVIITTQAELQFYLSLTNSQLPVQSQLIGVLPDLVLAEMVLGTISNVDEAVNWLAYTYLYVCMLRSPTLYGVPADELKEDPFLERRRADLIHTAATVLHQEGLINYDRQGGAFQVTDIGRVAVYYYVKHKSMATYNEQLRPQMSDIELFRTFCLSSEFKNLSVRAEEKVEVQKLLERVPIPVKEGVDDSTAKVNVLLQAYISRLKLEGFALMADMVYITQSAGRLIRALFDIAMRRGWAQLAHSAHELALMVEHRMWRTQTPLRQFHGAVMEEILLKLERRDFPWERMWDLNSQEIGELIRVPAKGKDLHRLVHQFPTLRLTAHVQPLTRSTLRVELTLTPDFNWSDKYHGTSLGFWITVEDCDGEKILYSQYFLLKKKFAVLEENDHIVEFTVPLLDPLPPQYFVRVFADRWLNSDTTVPISLMKLIPPAKFPPHDDVLDLRPLSVSALENDAYAAVFKDSGVKTFNQLQTQTFNALYKSDGNVFVGASTGSGIEVCGELAILRAFHNAKSGQSAGKVVYVAPNAALCALRKKQWEQKFGVPLEKLVLELTGDTNTDLKLLELGHIIISTPENWDRMSRRWKKRAPVQNVDLFLIDQLHLLSGDGGHIMEVIVSRMRFISSFVKRPIRIVALAASVANGRDVGEWIGATKPHTFSFPPAVRPVTLEMHLQGFDNFQFAPRLSSMTRPLIQTVNRTAIDKPVMIFVHARSHALTIAKALKVMCDGTSDPGGRFRLVPRETVEKLAAAELKNSVHRAFLVEYGIGIYHENMTDGERDLLEKLYGGGLINALIVTRQLCWSLPLRAYLVIVAGTEYVDSKQHRNVEYPIADVLQMVGMAGRQGKDMRGECHLYCYAPRKEFYKKYLFEALPLESQLDANLHNHVNSEIVTRTINTKQEALDYITWTFLYRRLVQNPNYYNLSGTTTRHLGDYLSQLVEDTINDLKQAGMVSEDGDRVSALNPGIIATYYYLSYVSVDLFVSSLTTKTKMRGLLEVVSAASEFDEIPVRQHEAGKLRRLAAHLPMKLESAAGFTDGRSKINVLMQAHFSRLALPGELAEDQRFVVVTAHRLMQAIVDIVSSEGWLSPALAAQELCQMLCQAMWDNDSPLLQLPHLGEEALAAAAAAKIETIYDFLEAEDKIRAKVLDGLSKRQVADIAKVANRYPEVEVAVAVEDEDNLTTTDPVRLVVQLEREGEGGEQIGPVTAPLFPKEQAEGWWLVVGSPGVGTLHGIKKVSFARKTHEKLEFMPPNTPGKHTLKLFLMSDSYVGCDQEFEVELNLRKGEDEEEEEEEEDGGAKPMETE